MRDPMRLPAIRLELTLADGTFLVREHSLVEVDALRVLREVIMSPPEWMQPVGKVWDHPQDPVTFQATVRPGGEADARKLVG